MSYQLLLAKKEVTPGTEVATLAADAVFAENVVFKPTGERVVLNPAKPSTSANPGVVTGIHAEVSFDVLFAASGTPGVVPAWGQFMKSCGYAEEIEVGESVAYNPLANPLDATSHTIVFQDSGRLHKALMWRGKVGFKVQKGQPIRLNFMGRAIVQDLAAGAALVPADADFSDWPELQPVSQARTTFSLGGVPLALLELSADSADNAKFFDVPGYKGVRLGGDRAMTGKVQAHMPPVGTYNPQTKWKTGSKEAFSLTDGTVAGSIGTIAGIAQLDAPSWSRVDEIDTFDSGLFLVGSSLSANDDISFVLT